MAIQFEFPKGMVTSKRAMIAGLSLLGGLGWVYAIVGPGGYLTLRQWEARCDGQRAQLAHEQAVNAELSRQIQGLANDPFIIEQVIRAELDYQRPGEIVFHIDDADPLRPAVHREASPNLVIPPPPREALRSAPRRPAATAAPVSGSGAPSPRKPA